jgi:hypothetical protein
MVPCPAIPEDNSKKTTARAPRLPRTQVQELALTAMRLPRRATETPLSSGETRPNHVANPARPRMVIPVDHAI